MRRFSLLSVALIVVASTMAVAQAASGHSVEKTFQSGGGIRLDLQAGDYTITTGSSNRIFVSWEGGRAEEAHATVTINGSQALIETQTPNSESPHFTIEVPPRSNIVARLSAGNIKIEPLEGNLDVNLAVGNLRVEVDDPQQFSAVNASTDLGNLDAGPFTQHERGWISHSTEWHGSGRYRMEVHVGTGNLNISASDRKPE